MWPLWANEFGIIGHVGGASELGDFENHWLQSTIGSCVVMHREAAGPDSDGTVAKCKFDKERTVAIQFESYDGIPGNFGFRLTRELIPPGPGF